MLAGFVRNEKRTEGCGTDNDDAHGGFSLQPEIDPCRIHLAMANVTTSDSDDGCDHRKDAKAKNPTKCELASYADAHLP